MDSIEHAGTPMGLISASDEGERRELQGILIACTIIAWFKNPDVTRKVTRQDIEKIKKAVKRDTIEVLERKIMALKTQNPGILSEAFEKCGYKMRIDGNGRMKIDIEARGQGFVGELVPYEKLLSGDI